VDGVHVGEDVLVDAVVVLDGDLDLCAPAVAREVDRLVQRVLALIQADDVLDDPALVLEGLLALAPRAFVAQDDLDPGGQVGQLAQALDDGVEVVVGGGEDLPVVDSAQNSVLDVVEDI